MDKETVDEKALTPEEIAVMEEMRKKNEEFMDEKLPYLRKVEEFERLNASIDKSRFEQFYFKRQLANAEIQEKDASNAKK